MKLSIEAKMRKSQWASGGRRRQTAFTNAALYRPALAAGKKAARRRRGGLRDLYEGYCVPTDKRFRADPKAL
jgi:hypothetical protein